MFDRAKMIILGGIAAFGLTICGGCITDGVGGIGGTKVQETVWWDDRSREELAAYELPEDPAGEGKKVKKTAKPEPVAEEPAQAKPERDYRMESTAGVIPSGLRR